MGRPLQHIVQDGILRDNLINIADRAKQGLPNLIIVFGPTRSGKTTFTAQCCKFLADLLKTKYDNKNIFFDTGALFDEAIKGKKRYVYHMDEAAFSLMGEDWQNEAQKNLLKLTMTAAKNAQTIWLIIPNLEKLRDAFIRDEHTRGVEMYFGPNYTKGYFKLYDQRSLLYKHELLKSKRYSEANQVRPFHRGRFSGNMDFIDLELYEKAKDEAIKGIGQNETSNLWKARLGTTVNFVYRVYGVPIKDLANNMSMMPNKVSELQLIYPSSLATNILETRAATEKKRLEASQGTDGVKNGRDTI